MSEGEPKMTGVSITEKPAPASAQGAWPSWPPPPRPRPSQGPHPAVKILSLALVALLILGGLGFIILTATSQYGQALGTSRRFVVNATERSLINAQATLVSSLASTAQPLATAQAGIVATATAQGQPTATLQAQEAQATATAIPFDTLLSQDTTATPDLDDPLTDNTLNNQWDVVHTDKNASGCDFVNGEYQVQEVRQDFLQACLADATSFSHFVYQVTMSIDSGNEGGIVFRANPAKSQYYLFRIDVNGDYTLDLYQGNTYTRLTSGTSDAIIEGVGVSNQLAVIADKDALSLFVNQNYIGGASNQALSAGAIGVAAVNTALPATASFTSAEVWKLP